MGALELIDIDQPNLAQSATVKLQFYKSITNIVKHGGDKIKKLKLRNYSELEELFPEVLHPVSTK